MRRASPLALAATLAVLIAACGDQTAFRGPTSLSPSVAPPSLAGLTLEAETKLARDSIAGAGSDALVRQGDVFLVKNGKYVAGSVEIYQLKPDVRVEEPAVLAGLDKDIPGQKLKRVRLVPDQVMWEKDAATTITYLWFPPRANSVEIVTLRRDFQVGKELVAALVDSQHGRAPSPFPVPSPPTPAPPPPILDNPGASPGTTVLPAEPSAQPAP